MRLTLGKQLDLRGLTVGQPLRALRLRAGQGLDALGVLVRLLQLGATAVLGDLDVDLRLGQRGLLLGDRHRLLEFALLVGRDLLPLERFQLLERHLPVAQLGEDRLDPVVAGGRPRVPISTSSSSML